MSKVETLIISGYGINCEKETEYAFNRAGAETKIIHINEIISNKNILSNCKILVFPGGFSFGDDIGSGLAFANYFKDNLKEQLNEFMYGDRLAIGICNGFQIMSHLGFFPICKKYGESEIALIFNKSNRYIDTWVELINVDNKKCIWTRNIMDLHIPIAHREGKFYADKKTRKCLKRSGQIVLKYKKNPNGSIDDIAGICDPSGKFFGLMPHPERAILNIQNDKFTLKRELAERENKILDEETLCMKIFKNAVDYFK